jgi:hypothetical protein
MWRCTRRCRPCSQQARSRSGPELSKHKRRRSVVLPASTMAGRPVRRVHGRSTYHHRGPGRPAPRRRLLRDKAAFQAPPATTTVGARLMCSGKLGQPPKNRGSAAAPMSSLDRQFQFVGQTYVQRVVSAFAHAWTPRRGPPVTVPLHQHRRSRCNDGGSVTPTRTAIDHLMG